MGEEINLPYISQAELDALYPKTEGSFMAKPIWWEDFLEGFKEGAEAVNEVITSPLKSAGEAVSKPLEAVSKPLSEIKWIAIAVAVIFGLYLILKVKG